MKLKSLLLAMSLASFAATSASAQTSGGKVESQRSIRDLIGMSPEMKKHVDRAMNMFRAEETCSTKPNRSNSKLCTEALTFDKALAANAAELKACQAACVAGAAGATTASSITKPRPNRPTKASASKTAADLASCVDKACSDECLWKERLFEVELDRYLKGSMMGKFKMNEFMSKRSLLEERN